MDILAILNILLKKWWLLLLVTIIAGVSTFYFIQNSQKVYKSTAQLATGFTVENAFSLKEERFDLRETNIKFDNLIEIMKSEQVLSLLSFRLALHDLKESTPFRLVKSSLEDPGDIGPRDSTLAISVFQDKLDSAQLLSSYDPYENYLITWLEERSYHPWGLFKNLIIKRNRNTDFVTIQFLSENPELSAFVVNVLCQEFIRYYNRLGRNVESESLQYFSEVVKEKKGILDEKTKELNDFRRNNQVLNFNIESETKIVQISDYEMRRQEELKNIQAIRLSITKLENDIKGLEQTETKSTQSNQEVIELRRKINDLNQIYIEGGSSDDQLLGTITNLRERLRIEMSKLSTTKKTEEGLSLVDLQVAIDEAELNLQIAQANLKSITNSIARLKAGLSNYASKEALISAIERELENARNEHIEAIAKYNEVKSESLAKNSSIRQILEGIPSKDPEPSKTVILVLMACFASFGLSAAVIVLVEFLDLRIKTPGQFTKSTGLKLAGAINKVQVGNMDLKKLFSNNGANKGSLNQFKQLLRKIRFEIEKDKPNKVILVTSTKKGEGKTFVILCLAYSLSLVKKKVLIIDTNFKNNSLTRLLIPKLSPDRLLEQINQPVGNLLESENAQSEDKEAWKASNNIINKTGHENIDIIGSSNGTDSPSEIFAGRDFKGMLNRFSGLYDYILMEGAALNLYSDSQELIEYVDKIVPVFSSESVIKPLDKESIDFLKRINGKLGGAVLNMVDSSQLKS